MDRLARTGLVNDASARDSFNVFYDSETSIKYKKIEEQAEELAKELDNREKTVLLIGNHAAHYYLKKFPRSTRYDSSNAYKIREIYSQHKDVFKLAHEEIINDKRYLFTHAGLMNSWIERHKNIIDGISISI